VPASKADTEAVRKLVEAYNAAVSADNGAKGCELLTAKEQQSLTTGSTQKSCAEVLTSMCKQSSQEKFVSPTVQVSSVIRSRKFPGAHTTEGPSVTFDVRTAVGVTIQAQDTIEHERGAWKLDSSGARSWTTAGLSESSRSKIRNLADACL
jgi:hypothetical protein